MLTDFTGADKVYIACGYTALRKGIDGRASLVQQQFHLDPFSNTLFLLRAVARQNERTVLRKRQVHSSLQTTETRRVSVVKE